MPSEIDSAQRLREIAEATLELARAQGPSAITVRAVAAHMGGSTTVVTKFVPSRGALLMNALRFVREGWDQATVEVLNGHEGLDRLRALIDWTLDTEDYDDAIRRLWNEILAKEEQDSGPYEALRAEARDELSGIKKTLAESGIEPPPWLADLLFLAFRGFFVSTVEDAEQWPAARAQAAVHGLIDTLAHTGGLQTGATTRARARPRGRSARTPRRPRAEPEARTARHT